MHMIAGIFAAGQPGGLVAWHSPATWQTDSTDQQPSGLESGPALRGLFKQMADVLEKF